MKDSRAWAPLFLIIPFVFFAVAGYIEPDSAITCLVAFMLVCAGVFFFYWSFSWQMKKAYSTTQYKKPVVLFAYMTRAKLNGMDYVDAGEFIVESSNAEHVVKNLPLPSGSIITVIERNKRYRVNFELTDGLSKPADRREQIRNRYYKLIEYARASGFDGMVSR